MVTFDFTGTSTSDSTTALLAATTSALTATTNVSVNTSSNGINFTLTATLSYFSATPSNAMFKINDTTGGGFSVSASMSVSNTFSVSIVLSMTTTPISRTGFDVTGANIGAGGFSAVTFTDTGNLVTFAASGATMGFARFTLNDIRGNFTCFTSGTMIATAQGLKPVEILQPGDRLLTADGRETIMHNLREEFVDTQMVHPNRANPICITQGALGGGLPERDLCLSPDHAIALEGCLITAGALVNGSSIYQVAKMPSTGFTYYHIETDTHELILAEGIAAESFMSFADDGADDHRDVSEMVMPRITTARLVPDHIRTQTTPAIAA